MSWRSLFNIKVSRPAAAAIPGQPMAANAPAPAQQAGSFVTPQSLLTFSGMTAAITVIWAFIEGIGGLGHMLWLGAVVAACCGALLYWTDASDPNRSPTPPTPMRILAAVVNTVLLFNAASGSYDLGTRAIRQNQAGTAQPAMTQPATTPPR
jgi:hypothetical protein